MVVLILCDEMGVERLNAVEIEEALSELVGREFDGAEFPYAFLEAFGNKKATIDRLRRSVSDEGGVLQKLNIHILVCDEGCVSDGFRRLGESAETKRGKVKFILATDGVTVEAEDVRSGETVVCDYGDLADRFGFFLPLAGITTVSEIKENAFDIKATGRLNRLYVELLRTNEDWGLGDRRHAMNHFMACLIFCFFAEDTGIFIGDNLFTATIDQMSEGSGGNVHEVLGEMFRAMNTKKEDRESWDLKLWAGAFPYVNGGLFAEGGEVPFFSKLARSYLLHIGRLDWKKINPDIFGSMVQAIADEGERGKLGMHYTSVPNILKLLNPLFLDDVRRDLERAGTNKKKLKDLKERIARIRVFDPACGSGNFLVIAYKELRKIEAEANERMGCGGEVSVISLRNFRGIELGDFAAEIARLALVIAEYQCDVLYRGMELALSAVLPLDEKNWILCGNALRIDWLGVCPPTGRSVRHAAEDLLHVDSEKEMIDFDNEGGETYICGNPPYLGSTWQSAEQKADLKGVFEGRVKNWKSLDYVAGWFMKAALYGQETNAVSAFVSTNSICQGQQVASLWSAIFETGNCIAFAHTSFKWANLASHNAGVTVVIVGIACQPQKGRFLHSISEDGKNLVKEVDNINAYLVAAPDIIIKRYSHPSCVENTMSFGNMPVDGGFLLLSPLEARKALECYGVNPKLVRPCLGAFEYIRGHQRYCLWITDEDYPEAKENPWLQNRFEAVCQVRSQSRDKGARDMADRPYRFLQIAGPAKKHTIIIPRVSSEARPYLPVGLTSSDVIIGDSFALYDAPLWNMALIASKMHLVWIKTVCGRLETRFRYSNTLGWNTFPIPALTEKSKQDLTEAAENILLAREKHFPKTIADLYAPGKMPEDLRHAHDLNDEILERIYIGRCFKNDTERLESLFTLYAKMEKTATTKKKT
jgi:hypothetical protein